MLVSQALARVGWHRAGSISDIPAGGTNMVPALVRHPAAVTPWLCPPAGLLRFEVPSLHVPPDATMRRDPLEASQRLSGLQQQEEEESESTAL